MNAQLNIEVAERNNCSYLKNAFFSTPLKLANITEDKTARDLQLMLMSSSPGILDRDEYDININIAANCAMQLHTQGYQRMFQMKHGARQTVVVKLSDNSSFCFLPQPSVPHEYSSFTGSNKFYLGNNCNLVYGEILTCGRKMNGEEFIFSKYHSTSNFYLNSKLVIKENLLVKPSLINVHAFGQLEGYTHQASMVWLQEKGDIKAIQSQIIELLASEQNITSGVTIAPVNGLIIRILGYGAEQLYNCLQNIHSILPAHIINKSIPAALG